MKLSIFTTIKNPEKRGDNPLDALNCYEDLADEVVIVNGGFNKTYRDKVVEKQYNWPYEFNWQFIGQQFQRGYEACTGDWVIHADLDFIFHERDFANLKEQLEFYSDAPAISLWKYQFIQPDRYNLKSRLVIAVNKGKYGDRIRFDSGGDLCQPSLDGEYINPDDVPEARIPFYNYEKLIKTEDQIKDDIERMDRAYKRHFNKPLYSSDSRSAYEGWLEMAVGRASKPMQHIKLEDHPKYVQQTIKNLKPEMWGYSGFGLLEVNDYV
jgi:glycosyltransferase involved in cell wall biosynthesis